MRIVLIGGTGTIGGAVVEALGERHEVVRVGRTRGEHRVDIAHPESVRTLYETLAPFGSVICVAGGARYGALRKLTDDDFNAGWTSKVMGQVHAVRLALPYIDPAGSFTLTSGILSTEPSPGGVVLSIVNAGVEAFVRSAALELPKGMRINAVSPPWVRETLESMGQDPSRGLPAAAVAKAFVESVEGSDTGQVLDARHFA